MVMDNVAMALDELRIRVAELEQVESRRSHHDVEANMTMLKEFTGVLESKRSEIEKALAHQEILGETKMRQDMAAWLRSAKAFEEDMKTVEKKAKKAKCFSRFCYGKSVIGKMRELKELLEGSQFPKQLVLSRPKPERVSAQPMRSTFDSKVEEIWEILQDKQVTKIGVYGMPGIGKTTALVRIREHVMKRKDMFDIAIWVDVSSDSSISSLQDKIADQLHMTFLNKKEGRYVSEESARAALLHARLVAQNRFALILDDMWNVFTLSEVGIPDPTLENGCKIVMTTRDLGVCKGMGTDKEILIERRPEMEALELFKESVGYRVCDKLLYDKTLPSIMEKIVEECAGLPLAIVTTARGLKDTTDPIEWEGALNDLRELIVVSEPIKRVIKILKLSYDRLSDGLKKCLLYCALFPEDHEIKIDFLVEHLTVERIVESKETRESETKGGREMVKKLQDVCLLNGSINYDGEDCVKMHDLIRDMALQIASESYQVRVGAKWESTPDEDKWNGDLSKVSLVNIQRRTLSYGPPTTSSISTLFLYQSNKLYYVSNEFFLHMKWLSVLDMSFTGIKKLPESVSDLVNLTALFVRKCFSLAYVPSLAKLKKLTKLDFYDSGIKLVPEGLDMLVNLRYLNFERCPVFIVPRRVLRKLVNIQYLALPHSQEARHCQQGPKVKAEDLELFTKLESFIGVLYDVSNFNAYVGSLHYQRLNNYVLRLGFSDSYAHYPYDHQDHKRAVYLTGNLQGSCSFSLPKDVNALVVLRCHNNTSTFRDFAHVSDVSELRLCNVEASGGIEHLFSSSLENKFPLLPKLETMNLDGVSDLCGLVKTEQAFSLPSKSFSSLKEVNICNCNNMKTLFSFEVTSLPNLEQLTLSRCEQLEAITSATKYNSYTTMHRLRRLVLSNLPKLRKIPLIADCLQEIHIEECVELRKIHPLLDSRHCSEMFTHVYIDRDTWGRLEWEDHSAKDFITCLMNPACHNDVEGVEAPSSVVTAVSPRSLEEEEATALFRRRLDFIAALFQWDFKSVEEVTTSFLRNILASKERPNLFQKDFDEIAAALFRRNLEDEEKEEVATFHRDLELLCVSFHNGGINVLASLRSKLQVEACFGRDLEVASLFWSNLASERLTRKDYAQAMIGSALLRRNTQKVVLTGDNSEAIACYLRNSPATPSCSNIAAVKSAMDFRMKLDSILWCLKMRNMLPPAYLLFIPRTGYYEYYRHCHQ